MRLANHDGRAVILTSDTTGFDVADASGGRFGPGIQSVYPQWEDFTAWAATASGPEVALDPEMLGPVSPQPLQSFGVGLNYADHAAESGFSRPEKLPPVFPKFQSSISGPFGVVDLVPGGHTDWEAELVVVVGTRAHRIPEGTGWDHVAGVAVGQDLSERITQLDGPAAQFGLGKSFPGYSPQGPWLVTPDELPDRDDLAITGEIDGEVVQDARTSQMIFPVASLIEKLAAIVVLQPGDVIYSGTPAGVGLGRDPQRFIQPGQTLVTTIEGVGAIRQTFRG